MNNIELPIHNLTGGQIQDILDYLLYEALAAVIRCSKIFDVQVMYLLSLTTCNKKRRVSALEREDFIDNLCSYLVTTDIEKRIEILRNSKIERGFIYGFLQKFLQETCDYITLYEQYLRSNKREKKINKLKLKAIERRVYANKQLISAIQTSSDYLTLAYEFRNATVHNYIRLAYKHAKAYCSNKTTNFDFQDVHQNFLAIITKAIDKYDSSKGALTSYINWWILNAQTNVRKDYGHEYGIAYTIPQIQKKHITNGGTNDVNFSVSLSSIIKNDSSESELKDFIEGDGPIDDKLIQDEEVSIVQYLAKKADRKGLARLYLDISETFSDKELRKMKQSMRKQLGIEA